MNAKRLVCLLSIAPLVLALSIRAGSAVFADVGPGGAQERASAPTQASRDPVKIPGPAEHPPELLKLADDLRALRERAAGVPDYAGTVARQTRELPVVRQRLEAMNLDGWSVHNKVDYLLLRSEMDNLDFTLRVWRPTTHDPGLYTRAAIGNVGRLLTGDRRFRGDPMPYNTARAQAILKALGEVGPILSQGKQNLTEMVPELAEMAIKYPYGAYYDEENDLKFIGPNMAKWAKRTAEFFPQPEAEQLPAAAAKAADELTAFAQWIQANRARMTGKFAIGTPALEWYTRNVLLMPYTANELRLMAEMERARAMSFMQFEMQKNRYLPQLTRPKSRKQFLEFDDETAILLRHWYVDDQQILTDRDDMPLMRSENGEYLLPFGLVSFTKETKPGVSRVLVPPENHPNVVASYFGFFTDPGTIHGHEYWPGHTFQGLIDRTLPCPIRRGHSDGANSQGWCFYNEELPVLLDFPFVRGPRTRELVYVNMIIRAERILIGLKFLAGEMTPEQAYQAFRDNVPGIEGAPGIVPEIAMREVQGLLTRALDHCQTGKLQIYRILADRKMQLKDKFDLRAFNDQVVRSGQIPFSLLRWEMTGLDDEVKQLWEPKKLVTSSAE